MTIDTYAYSSSIAGVKVWEKLAFAGLPMVLCLCFSYQALHLAVLLAMIFFTVLWGKISFLKYLKLLAVPCVFLILSVATIILDFSGVTKESITKGVLIGTRALACVSCFYFICLNTPINALLSFLQRCRLPQVLVELMELVYRFSFMVWAQARRICTAQGSRLGYKNFKASITSMAQLVNSLFASCIFKAEKINISVECRGYMGKFSYLTKEESRGSILVQVVLLNLLLIAFLILRGVLR